LDGELRADALDAVTRHIALCDECAVALSEAEDETAFAYSALEQEFNTLVPTQRLWAKINCSIEEERRGKSAWKRILAGVSVLASQLSKPSVAAFASLVLVVGTFSTLFVLRPVPDNNSLAVNEKPASVTEVEFDFPSPKVTNSTSAPVDAAADDEPDEIENNRIKAIPASGRTNSDNRINNTNNTINKKTNNNQRENIDIQKPTVTTLEYIPGEDSYVKTIATLKDSLDGARDLNMKPSARVAIERDLAVIDDAIRRMQAEVRKNPKNEAARQVLFASYQNKIDLLNSVSERNELMASIR
jgi:hypothetical protein